MLREISIPVALFAILASLLLPLPGFMIDLLLVVNLLFALVLLASTLYISEPLKLSALPSMLLLATLYRLALNVSTTRLILNSGQAGKVIEAFGEVVVQGNLIVGVVVFLIITIIQFLVIAKGAERVAEVAARFTLDALPGKQMSIDADVRAGLVDFETARQRRQDLQTESRFYGALDGAMKFIKGDAIAGLVITVINILGGLLVGILFLRLDLLQALRQFTLLTVGDGLASQLPALLNALSAGIVVTRVTRGDGKSLAHELPRQLCQLRSVKLIVGITALALAMMPHMPALPFVGVALALLISAAYSSPDAQQHAAAPSLFEPRTPPVLQVQLATKLARELYASGKLNSAFDLCRQRIFERNGLILNAPEFAVNPQLEGRFQILVRGICAVQQPCPGQADPALAAIAQALETLVIGRAVEFIDDILTRRMLDRFDKEAPELVSAVVPNVISVTQLTEILRGLVAEDVSIRNFDLILQAVAENGGRVRNERALLVETRIALRRSICAQFAHSNEKIFALPLGSLCDLTLSACEREGKTPETSLIDELAQEMRELELNEIVLVASKEARRLLRDILLSRGLTLPVLAYEEITNEIGIEYGQALGDRIAHREALLESLAA